METDTFVWKDEYSVGIQLIDEQHKIFLQMTNRIIDFSHEEPRVAQKGEELIDLLNDFENYALYHLGTEEEYFKQFNYKDAVVHIATHDHYRDVMKKLFNNARQESADVKSMAKEAAEYAGNWLVKHILVMDKGYTKVFIEHGVK